MTTAIATGSVHHLRLTVRDVARSQAFYTEVLGFEHVMDLPAGSSSAMGRSASASVPVLIRPALPARIGSMRRA